jgi:hypothetical protein
VAQASTPITFGQPFKAGDLQTNQVLRAADNTGAEVPMQTDEVSTHRNGSVRFAVISAQVSSLKAGERRIVNLFANGSARAAQAVPADPAWNMQLEAKVYNASGSVSTLVADPQALLKAQIASAAGRRMHGAVASEFTVVAPFKDAATNAVHPHLTARLHTRLYEGGKRIRTDVVLENNRTFVANPGNITYELAIKRNGQTVYTQPKFTHFHHASWHKVVWTGDPEPSVQVRHNMPYFLASKAVLNYDLNLPVTEATLAKEASNLAAAKSSQASMGPMGNVFMNLDFPATGGRPELGPLPRWTVLYLITQDKRAWDSMMANVDASAAVSIQFRDEKTGWPLDLIDNADFSTHPNASNNLPTLVNGSTPWSPDAAHQASFGYVPYLLTGDAFYLDSMMFWANYNVFKTPVSAPWREGAKMLVSNNEVRGQAWSMRSIAEAAWSLPDSHPRKAYYQTILQNNLAWYGANHKTQFAQSPLGAIGHTRGDPTTGPWQNDFVGLIFSLMAQNSEPQAQTVLNWISTFNVGRFMNDANGFCAARASGYYWNIKNSSGAYYSTWKDLFAANYAADVGKPCSSLVVDGGYPHLGGGYAAYARGMLGAAANAGVANAKTAYDKWKALTPLMDKDLPNEPIFAIVPAY